MKEDAAPIATVAKDAAVDAVPARKVFLHGAGRCGECHEKMFDEWETSAHARAATSPLYVAAAAAANQTACAHCHTPLLADAPKDSIASEGVTCDVCHTLRDPKPAKSGAGFTLAIDDMVKFGPRCDLDDHYFHRMGCSPEHDRAELCGSCHWWEPRGVPVFTEYADWKATGSKEPCQSCHMPKETASLAVGAPKRTGVPHHGFLGITDDLRSRALSLEVRVSETSGSLAVAVALTNVGAGHHVPAGLPERRIVVRARMLDQAGAEIEHQDRSLGRALVDAKGDEVPFWKAIGVGTDTRIAPGKTWKDTLSFASPAAGSIEVTVLYRGATAVLTNALALPAADEAVLARAQISLAKLPKTVAVKPPAPGKRRR